MAMPPPQGPYPPPGQYPPAPQPYGAPAGPPGAYPQRPMHPPPKKGMSGCVIALLIVGGLLVVGVLAIGYVIWRAWEENPEFRQAARAVGEVADIVMDAQKAPGTKELRDEANCKEALVFDVDRLLKVGEIFDAGLEEEDKPENLPSLIVMCQVGLASDPPSCKEVAEVYVDAVDGARGQFGVIVQKHGQQQQECGKLYDEDGKEISEFDGSSAPLPTEALPQ